MSENTDDKLKNFLLDKIKETQIENLNTIKELSSVYMNIVKERNKFLLAMCENFFKYGLIAFIIISLIIAICFINEKKIYLNSYCNKEKFLIEQKIKVEGMSNTSISDTSEVQPLLNNENNDGDNSNQTTENLTGGTK